MTRGEEPTGALFVVSTPIGNLADITARARRVLAIADVVACEDTRRTGSLLRALDIEAPRLVRVDAHTEAGRTDDVLARLRDGERVALVTDAGTPGISDPGGRLVAACVRAGARVVPVPGPSAALAALVASGLPTDRFAVEGFLPRRGRERADRLELVAASPVTTVLYESPHRLAATLADLAAACGPEREACVARELTKLHEQIITSSLGDLVDRFDDRVKGEVVVVVGPAPVATAASDEEITSALARRADGGASRRDATAAVAADLGVAKRRVYDLAVAMDWPDR